MGYHGRIAITSLEMQDLVNVALKECIEKHPKDRLRITILDTIGSTAR